MTVLGPETQSCVAKRAQGRGGRGRGGVDRRVAEIAERQHGVVSLAQLEAIGLRPAAAGARAVAGRLHRVHRGLYAVGHPLLSPRGRMQAAALACGAGAFISHRSAGALWGIAATSQAFVDVSSPGRSGRRHDGVRVHRGASALPRDVTTLDGIPCASLARTLLDLAGVVGREALARACEQAEILGLFDLKAIDDVLARARRRRGTARLRRVLAMLDPEPVFARSELERRFLTLCRRVGLGRPRVNAWVPLSSGGLEVDFLWSHLGLVAEVDGHRYHGTRSAFERDRRRDQLLTAAGYHHVRFTWRQVTGSPGEVTATLRDVRDRLRLGP